MPHAPDLSGRALDGRYELHAVIGEGTFGRVYRGRDRRLARPVAVKVIKPWWAEDPEWVRSFELEAQLLARVNDPGIVQIFDVGHAKEGLYYVAELVDGESLADRLQRGPLSAPEARGIAEQLCRALTRAHAQRVIHRDIKPANVLISARGQVKVGDFGVARLAEGSTDGAGATIVGTPRYMAPEQARGGRTGPATDVYGVGVVLYEMLAGRPPFAEKTAVELALRHLHDPPPPLPRSTPVALKEIVERALAKRPEDRYRSAGAMADALARAGLVEAGDEAATAPMITARRAATDRRPAADRAASADRHPAADRRPATPATATALLDRPPDPDPDPVAATRVQVPTIPRHEVYTSPRGRRRAAIAAGLALLVLGIVVAVGVARLTAAAPVRVPDLHGARRAAITAQLRRLGLKPAFHVKHSRAPAGSAIAESPKPGTKVSAGGTVRITLSDGPPPIPVPQLVGQPGGEARTVLSGLGLRATLTPVPAPGVNPGIVTRESPAATAALKPGSTVTLLVAEQPRWRPLTSFAGNASGQSVPFRILGKQWRVVYSMSYQGLCTLIFFCSGPNARVVRPSAKATVAQFGIGEGSGKTQVFASGPGLYQIAVAPGSDTAKWSVQVEDYY
ncbi:MAG: eukaryotic-like serine/threonine-protein kinase [Solirubrobacteraceae bacterium]|nr:eukaryotic-like serine/threonine-protein kinase [Solirubrobacteraceae bacterium]